MFNMQKMMKQAKEMQDKMQTMQANLENVEVTGTSGGGLVEVTATVKGVMKNIIISPDVLDPNDPDMVQDLVIAAVNDAKAKGDQAMADKTKEMMSSMGLPADVKLPF